MKGSAHQQILTIFFSHVCSSLSDFYLPEAMAMPIALTDHQFRNPMMLSFCTMSQLYWDSGFREANSMNVPHWMSMEKAWNGCLISYSWAA